MQIQNSRNDPGTNFVIFILRMDQINHKLMKRCIHTFGCSVGVLLCDTHSPLEYVFMCGKKYPQIELKLPKTFNYHI